MKQRKFFTSNIGRSLIALAVLAAVALIAFFSRYVSSNQVVAAQTRRQQPKTRPKAGTPKRKPVASSFKHESHRAPKTKLLCSNCHTIPARETPDEIAAATKSTIRGFPYHDSCLECHRRTLPQFFSGAAPTICTVCHTRSSPRLSARDVSKFPKQGEEVIEVEFPGYYPHDQRDHKRVNCATCHATDERAYVGIAMGSEAAFKPPEGTFKTSPSSHAACFKCHWQDEKPRKDDCAGCHLAPNGVALKPRNQLSANAREWFKSWPREWPKRLSIKFNHESKDHDEECTSCHDLTRIETLDLLKGEVPITTCASSKCHLSPTSRTSISKEMYAEEDDIADEKSSPLSRLGKHTCTGCHTSAIGSTPPPCSHLLLFADQAEDYPHVVKQISERCKK